MGEIALPGTCYLVLSASLFPFFFCSAVATKIAFRGKDERGFCEQKGDRRGIEEVAARRPVGAGGEEEELVNKLPNNGGGKGKKDPRCNRATPPLVFWPSLRLAAAAQVFNYPQLRIMEFIKRELFATKGKIMNRNCDIGSGISYPQL